RVVMLFNEKFRSDPRFGHLESGTVFDTNVYTHPVYELFHARTANGSSLALEPLQQDELKQLMYDQMATHKYLDDATWAEHKSRLIKAATTEDRRQVLEYALKEAETAKRAARNVIAGKLDRSIEFIEHSNPNALLRATNDAYGEVLNEIDKLRIESRRLEKVG